MSNTSPFGNQGIISLLWMDSYTLASFEDMFEMNALNATVQDQYHQTR